MISELTRELWETLDLPVDVYDGLVSDVEFVDIVMRRMDLKRFRAQWDGQGDWGEAYAQWHQTRKPDTVARPKTECAPCGKRPAPVPVAAFATAVATWLRSGAELPHAMVRKWRIRSCKKCSEYLRRSGRCRQCGCFIQLKARMKTEHCPLGRW